MAERRRRNSVIPIFTGWNLKAWIAFPAILMIWLPSTIRHAPQADVSGTWEMTVETKEGTAQPTITLKQDGERISGTYRGRMGSSRLEGTLKGTAITFVVNLKFQDVVVSITYSGTVTADTMKGTARFGDAGTGTWSAKRKGAASGLRFERRNE